MKKVFLTAFIAAAFAFGMASCNNNNVTEEVYDSTPAETTECCEHQHVCTCADTTCAMTNCENCTDTTCCKKECCKKDGECCKKDGECCKKDGAKEGECCKK